MENKNTSIFYNGLVWGVILGFVGIIYNVILYMLDQNLNQNLGYLGIIITVVLLVIVSAVTGIMSWRASCLSVRLSGLDLW